MGRGGGFGGGADGTAAALRREGTVAIEGQEGIVVAFEPRANDALVVEIFFVGAMAARRRLLAIDRELHRCILQICNATPRCYGACSTGRGVCLHPVVYA